MPWYFPWSDALNKRACRYLLQRYLGQFLQEKLSLDQLSVNLYSGTGKINDVYLDVEALNEAGEKYQLPIEIVDGFIKSISVSIPWASLLSESSVVEVHGLGLTLQPKPRSQSVSSAGSLWGSMVSSLQLAEEFMKERTSEDEKEIDAGQPFEALELFAQTIDTVFRRIKVTFTDTVIRLEQSIKPGNTGTALEIRIKRLEYYDEAGIEETSLPEEISQDHVYHPVAFATKKFRLEGVSLYTDEYCSKSQMWRSQCSSDPKTPNLSGDLSPRIIDNDSSSSSVKDDSKPASDEESEEISNLVLITKLIDHQEVRLKLKQDDNIPGPQAEVEFNFGPFPIFLCPRQIHLLFDIFNSLHSPTTTQRYRKQSANKPMGVADFTLVEQELQKHLTQPTVFNQRSLQQPQGWSTHSLDDSEEDFQPARGTSTMFASKTSASCDLDSSFESKDLNSSGGSLGKPSSLYSRSTRTKVQELLDDSSTGEVRFRLSCSSLCVVILHEDLRLPSKASPKTSQVLESKPNSVSEKFFDELSALLDTGDSLKDFIEMKSKITNICGTNHIRLMAAPLVIEGNRKSMATGSVFSISLTIADIELFECLMDELNGSSSGDTIVPTYTELLKFSGALPYSKDASLPYCNEPSLRLKYVQKSNTTQTFREHPSTLSLQLGPFQSEVDITIADRLHYLIKPQTNSSKWDPTQSAFNPKLLDEDRNLTTDRTDISLSSPFAELNIRFPVPDLRPVHSLERVPWWKKNLREETLVIEMTEVTLSNVWSNDEKESKYELQCKDAHGLLQMSPSEPAISFARISVDPRADKNSTEHGFDWPRLVLKITQAKTPSVLETNALEDDIDDSHMATSTTHSMYLHQMNPSPLSPFASRKIVYDRSSPEGNKFSSVGDTDQVVMPADKERMSEFIEKSMLNCKMTFDISLPTLNLILPSKNFYEIIYNRISNDLALWEPAAPKPVCSSESVYFDGYQVKRNLLKESSYFEAFSVCKSGAQYDSSSDSEDGGGGGNYYSVMGPNTHHAFKPNRKIFPSYVQAQSKLAINVSIGQGILNFCTKAEENDSEEYQGEFQINVEDGSFFFVSYYNGDPNLAYSCLNLNQGVLFHNGCVLKSPLKKLKPAVLYSPAHLNKTLYRSDPSVLPPNSTQSSSERIDLLSLVIRTGIEPNQGLKTFKVAVGLQEATLRHRMSVMPQSWLSQFINFFDVSNHPVVGYVPPPIVTELHLHLNTCAVDYRPLYLPLRALATVENFSISSNLAAQATTSLLRIISEELLIYISNKTDTEMVDLKNYVCVLDTGLFDVSLRMSDGKDSNQPVHDLRATNNCVHIHTCADSCKALQDLITYFASDGDLLNTSDTFFDASDEPYSLVYNGLYDNEPDTLVHRLMEDAMQESLDNISESSIEVEETEECKEAETLINETNPPYLAANNDSSHNASHSSDEFCILEEDLGSGIIPPSGEPQVRLLSHEPFNVIENHFAKPIGRSDQLKPPPHYPKPIRKYSLREMSLVWHLYGGCDFQTPEVKPEKEKVQKRTRIVSGDNDDWSLNNHSLSSSPKHKVTLNLKSQGSDFKKISPHESIWTNINSVQKECSSPETRCRSPQPGMGGIGRSHDVVVELQMNKMRFQYDLYPENGEYDSRQVLLIQDIEIRDRLASSEINKFLYQFSSEALPRQTHANMLLIKAVHVRPDPSIPKSECSLRVSLKPLRLNIDQDTLLFLCGFFGKLYGTDTNLDQLDENIPIQTNIGPDSDPILQSNYVRNEPLSNSTLTDLSDASSCSRSSPPVYFRSFVFSPDVPIQLDYHGKRVDMEQGALAGLLMGLGQLNKSKIILRRVTFRHGLLGLDRLLAYVINEWLQDIKKNQLPSLLGGLGPMYSFVQLFQGVRDLIWLPIEQYRKDGRIMRGIQRGANSFTTSTAMAFLELTNRMVLIIQGAAEFAYDMVSPGPSVKSRSHTVQKKWHLSSEPLDIREGVAYAYHVVREGIGDTARTIVRVASEEHDHKGMPGAVGGVLRQIPPIMVKPIILATEATSNVLGGVRNQLVPDARRDAVEKWRGRTAH